MRRESSEEKVEIRVCEAEGHYRERSMLPVFSFTYIAQAAEADRYEGGHGHEGDNNLDRSGYVCHLG
jgi:hypothetical protein